MPSKTKKKPRKLKDLSRWVGKTLLPGSSKKAGRTPSSHPANTGSENSTGSNSVEPQPLRSSDVGNLPNINISQLDVSFQVKDNKCAYLPSPLTAGESANQGSEQHKSLAIETDPPHETPFRRRIRTLTSSSTSAKQSPKLNRESWDSKSLSPESSRVWTASQRDSTITQDAESPEPSPSISTITPDSKEKKSEEGGSPRKFSASSALRYIRSPNDYMLIDFNYNEVQAKAAMNTRPSNEQMIREPEIGKSSFEELLAYVRRMTGTEPVSKSENNPKASCRPEDARPWNHRNLACIDCRKPCSICNTTCCMKQELEQKAADASLSFDEAQNTKHLGKVIEHLGFYAQEISTFAQCTPFDGCGRYVCPDCCGVCPNEICRDIQCKDCKLNPWDSCDWHD